jgi:hypothetical protein
VDTVAEGLHRIQFAENLIEAAELAPSLAEQADDVEFLDALLGLGGAYARLEPTSFTVGAEEQDLKFFLNTLYQTQNMQKGTDEMMTFFKAFEGSSEQLSALKFSRNTLSSLSLIPELQDELKEAEYLAETFALIPSDVDAYLNSNLENLQGTDLLLTWNAKSNLDLKYVADLMQLRGGYLINNEETLTTSGGEGSLISVNRKKYQIKQSSSRAVNIIAATLYGEGTFEINFTKGTVREKEMIELYAIGAVILNRRSHVLQVPNDLKWFADTKRLPLALPFRNRSFDQQIEAIVSCIDDLGNQQFDAYHADSKDLGSDWANNKYFTFMKNQFPNQLEIQAARVSLRAATSITADNLSGSILRAALPYIFYKRDYLGDNPNNDRADNSSRILLGTHYFWSFLSSRIQG